MSNVYARVPPFDEQFACDSVLFFHRFTAMLFQLPSRDFFIMVSAAVSTHCHSQHLPGSSRQNLPCILEMPTVCVGRNLFLQDVTRILVSMSVCLNGSGFHKNSSLKFSHHHQKLTHTTSDQEIIDVLYRCQVSVHIAVDEWVQVAPFHSCSFDSGC